MQLGYLIAAIFVLIGGCLLLYNSHNNKPLKLLSFFVVAYAFRHVNDSQLVWAVELLFILYIIKYKYIIYRDIKWYWYFVLFASFSLIYSDNPLRGFPGIIMYTFPLFYYALTTLAIKDTSDVDELFLTVSKYMWLLLILSIVSVIDEFVFVYYGMGVCVIPAYLFFKTKKKKYIFHLLICLLPAIILVKRTPLLGMSASMMVFSMLMYKWKAIIPVFLAVFLGVAIVLSIPSFRGKIFYGAESDNITDFSGGGEVVENVNMNGRLVFWSIMWEKYYEKSPFWGAGQGTVKAYLQSDKNEYEDTFSLMHNDWLLILCEQGITGVVLLIFFMIGIIKRCIEYSAKKYPKDLRLISAVCAGSIVSTMIHMFFENCMNTFIVSTSFVFYAIFNFCVRRYWNSQKRVSIF